MSKRAQSARAAPASERPDAPPAALVKAGFLLLLTLVLLATQPAHAQSGSFEDALSGLSESSFAAKAEAVDAIAAIGDERALAVLKGLLVG